MLLYNDVIDRNMDQFNKETNESHDGKTNSCSKGNFLKFFSIRLRTSFNESHGIFGELFAWLESIGNLVHFRIDSM